MKPLLPRGEGPDSTESYVTAPPVPNIASCTRRDAAILVEYVNWKCDSLGCSPGQLRPGDINVAEYPASAILAERFPDVGVLRGLYLWLLSLNNDVSACLPLLDFGGCWDAPIVVGTGMSFVARSALGSKFIQFRELFFTRVKKLYWASVLEVTSIHVRPPDDEWDRPPALPELSINRMSARDEILEKLDDSKRVCRSVLGQLHAAWKSGVLSDRAWRTSFSHVSDAGQRRAFFVKFVGEGVLDHGG